MASSSSGEQTIAFSFTRLRSRAHASLSILAAQTSFDTNAIAASSMFQLAFPYADGAAEAAEMAYLDRKFDTDRANGGMITKPRTPKRGRPKKNPAPEDEADTKVLPEGSTGVRLQGTWLPCEDAVEIAEEYGLLTYAQPLIDAKAVHLENGPQLVGADNVAVSTAAKGGESPSATTPRKRQRTAAKAEDSEADESTSTTASPKASRGRKSKAATKAAENGEGVIKSTTTKIAAAAGLTQKEIDEQIKKSKDLAKDVQAAAKKATTGSSSTSPSTRGRKRRASNERPTADLDHLADDSSVNFVSRQVRRGTRAVRRRPVVSAAGAMGAAAAAGVGALAWFAGGNVDVAQSLLQQGLTHLQGFFF